MKEIAKGIVSTFGAVVYALNFGVLAEPQKQVNLAKYHILLSGDLYQLHQDEEGSKLLSSHGISLGDTRDSVGLIVPIKDNYLVKVVSRQKAREFYISPEMGGKLIRICENDINDIEGKAEINLYGRVARMVFESLPAGVRSRIDLSSGDLAFASLWIEDSQKIWYATLPGDKKVSDLYRMEPLGSSKDWEVKKLIQKVEPGSSSLKYIDLTDEENSEVLLKFIEGKKYEGDGDFFISEGKSVVVHDSLASIVAVNRNFIEGVYDSLPSKIKESLPVASETEYVFIYPFREGIKLDIGAKDSYFVDLKDEAKDALINFISSKGYTNPLKLKP